ncbi:MAG: DsbA family oxidoreductase [Novosphingobium sp.]|uniref:DsbA family oxidoreductase n=1 Tax=Novosphingobium sp. TaxID=1874826 RepID=UPI001D72ECCA|nr:DsbA family oxidoreductase [Novosphingobium sp.]MCB2058624.1 DsbA family oxidoreductase [Novosphingobium sp.]MCP5385495.1 DsbA family oxidoreductase [Novosphingobium sp.]
MNAPARLTIDIWSDVMCPWCIIGYSQLQKALAQLEGEIAAEIRWLPFELNPDMPEEGEGQADHIARKYGRSPQEAEANRARLVAIGERAGYSFAYAGAGDPPPAMMWNTFAAHKLLKWALIESGAEAQNRLKLALFDAHFQQRRQIGDPQVLADVAASVGLDRDGALAAIADEALGQIVRREEAQAWDMNISGVPAMVVNGKFLIPGAQEPETYVQVLRKVVAKGL